MRVGLLGSLTIDCGDVTPVALSAARQRVVLAALALRAGRVVTSSELAEAVWDGEPPGSAQVTVRNYVLRLRLALGREAIITCGPGYLLDAVGNDIDTAEFTALCQDGGAAYRSGSWERAAQTLTRALQLWRGTPLVDVPSPALHREWVPYLERLRVQAQEQLAGARLGQGQHEEAAGDLERLAAEYPLNEQVHGLLMLAWYRCGRIADALAAYRNARQALARELGVEPGAELCRLHQQILARDPVLDLVPPPQAGANAVAADRQPPTAGHEEPGVLEKPAGTAGPSKQRMVPRQLPAAVAGFTGRVAELQLLESLAEQAGREAAGTGPVVIAAISGTAGVGKTALAVHFAHQVADQFPDGQLYANLRGSGLSRPVSPGQAIRWLLTALRVPPRAIPPDPEAQAGLYRSLLAGKRMLVLLDNAHSAAQIRSLLPGAPGCLVLVTSRKKLTALAAADGARLLPVGLLDDSEARELLANRVGAARATAEPEALADLARLCVGLPLALAIAAARSAARPGYPLAALCDELDAGGGRLGALDAGEPEASLRAVFSWSYRQLRPATARMFRLLGLHPGPDLNAKAAASLADVPLSRALGSLSELTDAGLAAEHVPGRYALHDLLRAYAAGQARGTDSRADRKAAVERMLDHYLHTAHAADREVYPYSRLIPLALPAPGTRPEIISDRDQAMSWFRCEHEVLCGTLNVAQATGHNAHAWQLPLRMEAFLHLQGRVHDAIVTQRTALAALDRGEPAGEAEVRRALARSCVRLGAHDEARSHLALALSLFSQVGDLVGRAQTRQVLAHLCERETRYRQALRHNRRAFTDFRAAGHAIGEAKCLNNMGWLLAKTGKYEDAIACCERSVQLHQKAGDHLGEAFSWDSLGYTRHRLSHYTEAAACYARALDLFREAGDRYAESEILSHIGDTYHATGDGPATRQAWGQALAILDDLHHADAALVRAKLAKLGPLPEPELSEPGTAAGHPITPLPTMRLGVG
jgi:DNA-binding SARP family transcriptional activator